MMDTGTSAMHVVREDDDVTVMSISREDCGFIMGKNGVTKNKIGLVSGTRIELQRDKLELEIYGTVTAKRHAVKYVNYVLIQRLHPVDVTDAELEENCTVVDVPTDCVGLVTGRGGNYMRSIEQDWNVLMFFATIQGKKEFAIKRKGEDVVVEKLAIFGSLRGRRGAELKMMSSIEQHWAGHFTSDLDPKMLEYSKEEDFGCEIRELCKHELGYAMGKRGSTRKKIAAASGAIVEYVNTTAFFAGTQEQIDRAKQYLQWLFDQMNSPLVISLRSRTDWTILPIPTDCIGFVTGQGRESLSRLEEEKDVLMFFCNKVPKWKAQDEQPQPVGKIDDGADPSSLMFPKIEQGCGRESERLYIFGSERNRKAAELKLMSMVESKNEKIYTTHFEEGHSVNPQFDVDIMNLTDAEVSFALGRQGQTRKKLATASNCILEYIGLMAFMAGEKIERKRCRDFLCWLLKQQNNQDVTITSADLESYKDYYLELPLENEEQCNAARKGGVFLRQIEADTATYIVNAYDDRQEQRVIIFGPGDQTGYGPSSLEQARDQVDDFLKNGAARRAEAYKRTASKRDYSYDSRNGESSKYRRSSSRQRYGGYENPYQRGGDYYSNYKKTSTSRDKYYSYYRRSSRNDYYDRDSSRGRRSWRKPWYSNEKRYRPSSRS